MAEAPAQPHIPITPVPLTDARGLVPPSLRQILVLGGSFDPPHLGHVQLPLVVRQAIERASSAPASVHLLLTPAARSPHKAIAPRASDADRLAMLALATEHLPRVSVWTDELDRARASTAIGTQPLPSYTVDTLTRLQQWLEGPRAPSFPGGTPRVRLLIGADQALALHRWRSGTEILRRFAPVVMLRPAIGAHAQPTPDAPHTPRALLDALASIKLDDASGPWDRADLERWERAIVPVGTLNVSSTLVREALAQAEDASASTRQPLDRMLDPLVLKYIRERGLYLPQ